MKPRPRAHLGVSPQQREVWRLVATGATNKQIAKRFGMSLHTVKSHLWELYPRIGASNRIQAAVLWYAPLDAIHDANMGVKR